MRKVDPQYIVNLGRQMLGQVCTKDAKVSHFLERSQGLPLTEPSDVIDAKLRLQYPEALPRGETFPGMPVFEDHDLVEVTLKNVAPMQPTTLGKIVSFGLKPGEVCEETFRKTPFTNTTSTIVASGMNGRELLVASAVGVILAAVHDYCMVIERVRRDEGNFIEVGRRYITES